VNGPGLACGALGIAGTVLYRDESTVIVPVRLVRLLPEIVAVGSCLRGSDSVERRARPSGTNEHNPFGFDATLRAACSRASRCCNRGERRTSVQTPPLPDRP
jgi:hypothetical protein